MVQSNPKRSKDEHAAVETLVRLSLSLARSLSLCLSLSLSLSHTHTHTVSPYLSKDEHAAVETLVRTYTATHPHMQEPQRTEREGEREALVN
jgi:hypothetical protein